MLGFLRCLGAAIVKKGVRGLIDEIPFGGVLVDVCEDFWSRWTEQQGSTRIQDELRQTAAADRAQVEAAVAQVVREEAATQPPAVQATLTTYLTQVPDSLRRSFRRPEDPTGTTIPPAFSLQTAKDLVPMLPARLPRFKPGDRPLPGIDWELVELLGVGGFGEVWKARNPNFSGIAPAALKFCLDPSAKDRLLRHEATVLNQVMSQGKHPGIVPLRHTYLSADPPCLEYEYVEGGDLTGLMKLIQRLPPPKRIEQARKIIQVLADTVGRMHRLSPPVIHRDLKPANVLARRAPEGGWKLLIADFGIGAVAADKQVAADRLGTTTRGDLLATIAQGSCTPLYASPQQKRGDPPDPRDDVHALGVIWYQLLWGNPTKEPPQGGAWKKKFAEQGVPSEMVALLEECLEGEKEDRPADAAALATRIRKLIEDVEEQKRKAEAEAAEAKRKAEEDTAAQKQAELKKVGEQVQESSRWPTGAELAAHIAATAGQLKYSPMHLEKIEVWNPAGNSTGKVIIPNALKEEHLEHLRRVLPGTEFPRAGAKEATIWKEATEELASTSEETEEEEASPTNEGLRRPQVRILAALAKATGPLSRKEISEQACLDIGWVSDYTGHYNQESRTKSEARYGHKSLVTLGYATPKVVVVERKELKCWEITEAGRAVLPGLVAPPSAAFPNGLAMKFVRVPAGTFWMGGGGGQPGDKQVQIPADFYFGVYPVTQEQWQAVMGGNPSYFSRTGAGKEQVNSISDADLKQFPVEQVSWEDAQEFIRRLNDREQRSGWTYRLPTEAEWEYACRGGASSQHDCSFHFYFDQPTNDLSSDQANFDGTEPFGSGRKGVYLERTTKVGSYKPNRLGIHDMHGNVWEWCQDLFEGSQRMIRGGAWDNSGEGCQVVARDGSEPTDREYFLGVRLVAQIR